MKEITRIHIAKISYDIELLAKKDIEKYIKELELYADDKDVLQDIEIRMTELLAERGVKAGGVIVADDVAALRQQLGEPHEFGTGDIAIGDDSIPSGDATRKLYRNIDSAVFGGVLSGIASFFRINPLWTRLLFIIVLFASFGTALLVYVVLWIAIPPARTAAEKLQMAGRPVTLGSIRELNDSDNTVSAQRAQAVRRTIIVTAGVLSIGAAVIALGLTAAGLFGVGVSYQDEYMPVIWGYAVWLGLMTLAGVLLATLFVLVAVMLFRREATKRLMIAAGVVVATGLLAAGVGVGGMMYQMRQTDMQLQAQMREMVIEVPAGFGSITDLTVTTHDGISIRYVPSSTMKIVVNGLPQRALPKVTVDGKSGQLTVKRDDDNRRYGYVVETVTVYGPQLANLSVTGGEVTYEASDQAALNVTAKDGITSLYGHVASLTVDAKQGRFDGSSATVERANVTLAPEANVELGNIKSLQTQLPEVCPSDNGTGAALKVRGIIDQTIDYNGQRLPAKTKQTNCSSLLIGDDAASAAPRDY